MLCTNDLAENNSCTNCQCQAILMSFTMKVSNMMAVLFGKKIASCCSVFCFKGNSNSPLSNLLRNILFHTTYSFLREESLEAPASSMLIELISICGRTFDLRTELIWSGPTHVHSRKDALKCLVILPIHALQHDKRQILY